MLFWVLALSMLAVALILACLYDNRYGSPRYDRSADPDFVEDQTSGVVGHALNVIRPAKP